MSTDEKPFFMPGDFVWENQAGDAVYIVARVSADRANAKVAPLVEENARLKERDSQWVTKWQKAVDTLGNCVQSKTPLEERIESQQKLIVTSRQELDATFKANDFLREENVRLKESSKLACEATIEMGQLSRDAQMELSALKSLNATYRQACEAAIRYDKEIYGRAKAGDYEGNEVTGAIARGVDLDDLYEKWILLAREALAAGRKEDET